MIEKNSHILIIIAGLFYLLWFKDVVPAIIENSIPKTVRDYDLLVNPVHVLDIAIALPGLIITALLLIKKVPLGYVLTPMLLVFVVIMAIALAGMVFMLKFKGISDDTFVAGIFITLAIISAIFLIIIFKNIKNK